MPGNCYPLAIETFYLGTHQPDWLRKTDVPLFISVRRLRPLKRLPLAKGPWAIDSGGFSELSEHGRWTLPVREYVAEVRRYVECIGKVQWAAAQDWMVEPQILHKTGLTVEEHQRRTLHNYLELLHLAPDLPWAPVIQGWTWGDYMRYPDLGIMKRALSEVRTLSGACILVGPSTSDKAH